jgi:hypothetical protein
LREARFGGDAEGESRSAPRHAGSSEGRANPKAGDTVSMGKIAAQPARRGRPLEKDRGQSLEALKPWETEGISRRTWFRRRAEDRE